jgi:eukaryotic-like serine/threonine-protein kinase
MSVVPGDNIGPYVILRPLGQGGMGQVFLADDCRLHRKVALKYLHARSSPEATIRASLLREAQTVARITHPHVAIVHDVIDLAEGAFLVMEYVQGETLSERLARVRLPISVVIEFGRQLASATLSEPRRHPRQSLGSLVRLHVTLSSFGSSPLQVSK